MAKSLKLHVTIPSSRTLQEKDKHALCELGNWNRPPKTTPDAILFSFINNEEAEVGRQVSVHEVKEKRRLRQRVGEDSAVPSGQ